MARKSVAAKRTPARTARPGRPSSRLDTRIIYCGDCLDQLAKLPDGCVDLIYIDPPFNSNRNYEIFWGETKEKRPFADGHASTQACIEYMRPRCRQLARVLKPTGSFYSHCDWHASHPSEVARLPRVSRPRPPATRDTPPDRLPAIEATWPNGVLPATMPQRPMNPVLWFGRRSVDSD